MNSLGFNFKTLMRAVLFINIFEQCSFNRPLVSFFKFEKQTPPCFDTIVRYQAKLLLDIDYTGFHPVKHLSDGSHVTLHFEAVKGDLIT